MREQVIATLVGCDKPETLTVVEPLDGAGIHETLLKMDEQWDRERGPGIKDQGGRGQRTSQAAVNDEQQSRFLKTSSRKLRLASKTVKVFRLPDGPDEHGRDSSNCMFLAPR